MITHLKHLKPSQRKPLVGFVAVCLCALIILASLGIQSALAGDLAEEAQDIYAISSSADLILYADAYARGGRNPNDTLRLALSSGTSFIVSSAGGYVPIGNDDRPFNGKIEIADNAINSFVLDTPLFGTITTDVQIVNASNAPRQVQIARLSEQDSPLFAESVVSGTSGNAAAWDVLLVADTETDSANPTAFAFAGVIGSIGDDCEVSVAFTHDSVDYAGTPADVKSAGDVGLICGSLGENAELTFTVDLGSSMAGKTFNVSSTGGNAGGIVGVMDTGATLKTGQAYTSLTTVSTTGGYAGALVGSATDAELDLSGGALTLTKTVTGTAGAGGLYGYYKSTIDRTLDLEGVTTDSNFTLAGGTDVGILAGMLEAEGDVTVTESNVTLNDEVYTKQVSFTGGTNRGGLIGKYTNNDLDNTLTIEDIEVKINTNSGSATASGGAVGVIAGDSAVYAEFGDFRLKNADSSNLVNGGLIGDAGANGSFIDVTGNVNIDGKVNSGLIHSLNAGILRLSGTTDLTDATYSTAQLVGTRGNALIYAMGSGSDANWTFKRGTGNVDDVGDWGEVVRLGTDSGLSESDLFTEADMAAHTRTVKDPVNAMGSLVDFVKTALNMQLNVADCGALRFHSSTRNTDLAGDSYSLTDDIDLSDSGIGGLTRDCSINNPRFTGTFDGNGHAVTLAIGEPYGKSGDTTLTTVGDNNYGTIIGHTHLGLFGKVGTGADISDLTVDGYISVWAATGGKTYNVGGVAGSANGMTLSEITTEQAVKLYTSANANVYAGGAVGCIDTDATGTIAVSDSVFHNAITHKTTATHTEGIGGAIGHVAATGSLTLNFSGDTVKGSFNNTATVGSSNYAGVRYGGLIGTIAPHSSHTFSRNVTLTNVTVDPAASITTRTAGGARTALSGSFLGAQWLDTNVTIGTGLSASDGVTLGSGSTGPSLTTTGNGSDKPTIAALVGRATGHWTVNHVAVNKAAITTNTSNSNFGFLVGDGTASGTALYLDLNNTGYNIAATTLSGTYSVYDEIVGFSTFSDKTVADNGNAVVSIRTAVSNPTLVTSGASCNTYQNQIAGHLSDTNENTRYYYNLDFVRASGGATSGNANNAKRLLLWSLNKYAHSSISGNGYFGYNYKNTLNNNCDMTGLSYYPVDASGVTVSSLTVKFYNHEIETGEGLSGGDNHARSTRASDSQHYLMHEGLFRNYTGALTVNGLTVKGNVSNQHGGNNSGFLVCGTLGGTNTTDQVTISNVTLAGAYIDGRTGGDYAPLLINKIGKNVKFSLSTVTASTGASGDAYSNSATSAVASSLIGDVGGEDAVNISLTFSDIRLDARTSSGADGAFYGTTRSIFDRATLLNSFRFLNGSMGQYNYTYDEDWTDGHHVTYGYEVSESTEYAGREDHYYDDSTNFTDPTGACTSAYDFSSGYLRYVYTPYNTSTGYHEIKVNIKDVDLTTGCGKYNDPYQISDGEMLVTAANIISGALTDGVTISLPNDVADLPENLWCSGHSVYVYSESNDRFEKSSGSGDATVDTADAREYLAGAYYSITQEITLPAGDAYVGLGAQASGQTFSNYSCPYAFRGVIVGSGIINKSSNPLVKTANGCVVKVNYVTVHADAVISITQGEIEAFGYDVDACNAYGAVIGRILGGDNVIDGVTVNFLNTTKISQSGTGARLVPIGGYVGVVVNGGLVFRNMDSLSVTGLPSGKCNNFTSAGYLYINPIVGRVVAGYVFNESDAYRRASLKLDNGTKNYVIPDLNPNAANKLTVTASTADNHVVTAPDAQTLYILSCIVNSGAGSANYGSTEQAYKSTLTGANSVWIGWRGYCATHCGNYTAVGTAATNVSGSDYHDNVVDKDKYKGFNKVPYIVRQYTQIDGTVYRARSLCGAGTQSTVAAVNLSNTTYDLPNGFRGINSLYTNDTGCYIRFNRLNGNNAVIDLAMKFAAYNTSADSTSSYDNIQTANDNGFGLFNRLYQREAATDTTLTTPAANANVIRDLTLTGSVEYWVYKVSDGKEITYLSDYNHNNKQLHTGADNATHASILSTGGLTGYCNTVSNLYNVNMGNLRVEGVKYTGGLIGNYNGNNQSRTLIIRKCGSTSGTAITVKSGVVTGGLIGLVDNTANVRIVGAAGSTTVTVDKILIKCNSTEKKNFYDFQLYGAGGLIGKSTSNPVSDDPRLIISDVKIVAKSGTPESIDGVTANIQGRIQKTTNNGHVVYWHNTMHNIGGVIGITLNSDYMIERVSVESMSLFGCNSGGIIGYSAIGSTSYSDYEILNCTVDGKNTASFQAIRFAGGIFGRLSHTANIAATIKVKGCTVQGQTLKSLSSDETWVDDGGAGTLAGGLRNHVSSNKTFYLDVVDYTAKNCNVMAYYRTTGSIKERYFVGTGGLIGSISANWNGNNYNYYRFTLYGNNILLDTINIQHYVLSEDTPQFRTETTGYVCGNNTTESVIKLVGVSIQNCTELDRLCGRIEDATTNEHYGDGGYVILADFDAITANTSESSLYVDAEEPGATTPYDRAAADPYVTVNPGVNIGSAGLMLTGDGVALDPADLPIHDILVLPDNRYNYSRTYTSPLSSSLSSGTTVSTVNASLGKLSTYNVEQSDSPANDFAVLIVDDVRKAYTTNLINAYLNLLTNTRYDYATGAETSVYSLNIYNMVWNGTAFADSGNDPSLKLDDSSGSYRFYMDLNQVDTAGQMFSLIDVAFYDPADTDYVAYHLYVPVLVKKMLTFDFKIATGTGTNYERGWYDDRFGEPLMDNLGTPVSLFFKYSYQRTQEEWQAAIENGDSLLYNFNKSLTLTKSSAIGDLPGSTVLALVDVNRGGKPYYATFGTAYSAGVLSLSAFHEILDDNTSAAFDPVDLCDMLDLTASLNNTDGKFVTCAANVATVKAKLNGVDTYFRLATDGDPATPRYDVTVNNTNDATLGYVKLEEPYYLSFFTDATTSNVVYHYTISAPSTFGDNAHPSRIATPTGVAAAQIMHDRSAHLILGNIFVQSGVTLSTVPNNTEMSILTGNHEVTATMGATVQLAESLKSEVQAYLGAGSGINVFHSFVLNLTMNDETGSRKIIAGSPAVSGTYGITSVSSGTAPVLSAVDPSVNGSFAEIYSANLNQNINDYLVNGNGAVVAATVTFNYGNESAIAAQFPNRENVLDTSIGTTASCTSNIAYDRAGTAFSKVAQGANDSTGHSYYCRIDNRRAALSYNVKSDVFLGDYGPLGINPLDEDAVDEMPVSTLAVYNIADIVTPATGYDLVRVKVRLFCRTDDYTAPLNLATYITEMGIAGFDNAEVRNTSNATEYVFTLSRSALESSSALATSMEIPINYKILTGAPFESAGLTYSNYKISLAVELTKSTDHTDVLDVSIASDYLIYTNAHVLPNYVEPIVSP